MVSRLHERPAEPLGTLFDDMPRVGGITRDMNTGN